MPKKQNGDPGGFWLAIALLSLALLLASLVGVFGLFILKQLGIDAPVYVSLIFASFALILVLQFIGQRNAWILPWYYLLPAILFLLSFTFFPVALTVFLGFTDYAGIRNGELNISTSTSILSATDTDIQIDSPETLQCDRLQGSRRGCNNIRALVYASGDLTVKGLSLEENVLTLAEDIPKDRAVTSVDLFIPSIGFAPQFSVESVEGNALTLSRSPPEDASIESIKLRLDREPINRRILTLTGDTVKLDRPLPDDLSYVSIARFNDFGWVGLDNFTFIFSQIQRALGPIFLWNVSFAFATIIINTTLGVFIALLLNNPYLRFRNLYRTLLIIPWALPNIITIQVWKGFLNENFGSINRLLALLDLPTYNWLGDQALLALAPKAAILLVNLWLGLPFMMTATLGALSAIPRELYEAARVDGANPWQGFWHITAPLLRAALVPITLTGFAFNFNNFNVIFLLTEGGPPVPWGTSTARGTDILISWAYNEAFRSQGGSAYGLASAISLIIFVITIAVSLVNFRVTGALKEEPN